MLRIGAIGQVEQIGPVSYTRLDVYKRQVLVGPHPGQGALLLNAIDPSVADENDALSVAPELDPLAPANGYRPGGQARYAPDFVERYRAAQRQRVARLDALARRMIDDRMQARAALKEQAAPTPELRRQAAHTPVLVVWRTDAAVSYTHLDVYKRQFSASMRAMVSSGPPGG